MKPYRRHLIGLPLQRSVFSDIDRAPVLIGLTGVLPGDRMGTWLDGDGDLFLDRSSIERLATALRHRLSPEFLGAMERSIAVACDAVQRATESCSRCARDADADEVRHLIGDLGASLRTLVPFGILSKFVPDVLYRAFAATPRADLPRLPGESPGAVLTRESYDLFSECRARGFAPDQLLTQWPDVPVDVADHVRAFCRRQAGFGPLLWEAPGYENPQYVFGILQATFAEEDLAAVRRRLDVSRRGRHDAALQEPFAVDAALAHAIGVWRDFLERETWYVRRAFLVGLLPLLLRLVAEYRQRERGTVVEDILFLELDELAAPLPDMALARARRARYLANEPFLAEHGISGDRLSVVLEAA